SGRRSTRSISSRQRPANWRCSTACARGLRSPNRTCARQILSPIGFTSGRSRGRSSPEARTMNTTTVDLRAEALVEAPRLATLRAVAPDRDPGAPPVDATLGYVHRTRLRHRLGGWMLLIWRAACEDASGRIAASAIVPMLVRRGRDRRGRETGSWLRNVV